MVESWKAFISAHPSFLEDLGRDAPYTDGRELEAVCLLARASRADHLIEIGTAYGHTAVALAMTCPFAAVTTFDVCRELVGKTDVCNDRQILPRKEHGSFIHEQSGAIRGRIRCVVSKPTEGASLLKGVAIEPFQFAYIDGAHERQNVSWDTRAVLEKIDDGGFIVWDDYWSRVPGVVEFINTVNRCTGNRIVSVEGTRVCYLKVERVHRELLLQSTIW